jgi:hypothetical protein
MKTNFIRMTSIYPDKIALETSNGLRHIMCQTKRADLVRFAEEMALACRCPGYINEKKQFIAVLR